jgi:hypothetical protein
MEVDFRDCGCLAHNFNMCLCYALNHRVDRGFNRWAMLHSDIVPEPWWLDTLADEQDRVGADVMSAVVPIKDNRGFTSSGVGNLETWDVKRFTMTDVHKGRETFNLEDVPHGRGSYLAANVGCMLCKFDGHWEEKFAERGGFRVLTTIRKYPEGYRATFYPDDWDFSRWCHLNGLSVWCTRKVRLSHRGEIDYSNTFAWGEETDTEEFVSIPF